MNTMKIEYELPDEEFHDFISSLNNSLFLLGRTYWSMKLVAEVPRQFEEMFDKYSDEELNVLLDKRLKSFQKFYRFIEELEERM